MLISDDTVKVVDLCQDDPHNFDYKFTTSHELDCVKVDLVDDLGPSILKDKPYTFNESYLSDYYRFV